MKRKIRTLEAELSKTQYRFFHIIQPSLRQLKKKVPILYIKFWIRDVGEGNVCFLFCFALNERIKEAFPKIFPYLIWSIYEGLRVSFGCLVAKLSPPYLS